MPKQMLRPKGAEGCFVSCFGSRKLLNHASIASRILFVLCIALTPQSGDSSGAILEVPFKALLHLPHARNERTFKKKDCLNFPEKDSFLTEERLHTRKEPHGCAALLHILARACSLLDYSLSLAFGNRIALTDDFVIIEATDTSALPTKSRTSRGPGIFILCPNLWTTYASMNDSAIEHFVEQRRRAQQPLVGIASSHWRNVKRLRRTAAMSGGHCKE